MKIINNRFTRRESEVMEVLWNQTEPMSALDLSMLLPKISRSTIQTVLRNLYEKDYIKVGELGINKNALTRKYQANITHAQYLQSFLSRESSFALTSEIIENTSSLDEIEELEALIQKKKEELLEPQQES